MFNSCTTVDLAGGQLPRGWWSSSQRVEVLWWTFIHLFTAWQMCWQKHYSYLFHVNAMIKKSGVMCSWVCIVYVECWTHWNLLAWVETLHNSNKTVMGFWFWSTSINSCFCTLIYGSWTFITWRKSSHKESNHSFVGGIQTATGIIRPSATKKATSSDEINIQSLTDSWNIFLYNMTLYWRKDTADWK